MVTAPLAPRPGAEILLALRFIPRVRSYDLLERLVQLRSPQPMGPQLLATGN